MSSVARGRCTRVACYGWVDEGGGSLASGHYLLLRELTRRGVSVDLFAERGHVPQPTGLPRERFRYLGFEPPLLVRLVRRLPKAAAWALERLCLPAVNFSWRRTYQPTAEEMHSEAPYDVILALGTTSQFELSGVPTVTWMQGAPSTELDAIRRLRGQIVAASGWRFYLALVAIYRYSEPIRRRALRSSDRIVVGSDWSRRASIDQGFDSTRVDAVPYGIDLDLFRPANDGPEVDWSKPRIVALGRLDPRKRLDLLLETFHLVILEHPGATLQIVGRPGYTPRQLDLIQRFPVGGKVSYEPHLPHEQVPRLLQGSTVLVQPSENENFGSSVAEALACGTPVVVGPSNGTAQYIDQTSQVFESYTPEAVARAISTVIRTGEHQADDVRRGARAAATRWFEPSAVADRLIAIMEAAIAEAREVAVTAPRAPRGKRLRAARPSSPR